MTIRICRSLYPLLALIAAACLVPPAQAEGLSPLNAQEQEAVVAEIRKMLKTDVNKVDEFVVEEATPERIERLYHTPAFLHQPKNIRENGLIFASKGNLLAFDKPSDVIAKVSSWFPDEIAEARTRERSRLWSGDVHLWGALLEDWEPEPVAFVTLWRCMPQSAWLRPERNPFERRVPDDIPMLPIGANSSAEQEFEFGFCVRNRNRDNWGMTIAQHEANQADIRNIGQHITPTLTDKFAQHLAESRCEGRGPDDCVLVLRLWASLTPDDARLAAMLQRLEADIGPDGPLPELLNREADPWQSPRTFGEERYDEGLRRLAYLRAKLLSVLNAPQAWPSGALAKTLRQMTRLRQAFATRYVRRWSRYEIDSHNDPISPWRVLMSVPAMVATVRSAILAELELIDTAAHCDVFEQWFEHDGPILQTTFALQQLTAQEPSRCAYPDLAWLREGKTAEAKKLRDRYLALAETSGLMRDGALVAFTDQAERCFAEESDGIPLWVRELCDTWISEPQYVGLTLEHSRLTLDPSKQFHATEHAPPGRFTTDQVTEAQDEWLTGILAETGIAPQHLDAFAADLRTRNVHVTNARIWRHPGHVQSLIELQLVGIEYDYKNFAAGPGTLTAIDMPYRFFDHYGENDIVRVSDLDEDGNLELWMADAYDFNWCAGDESDLEREIDCTAKTASMGEIQGDVLSFFVKSKASPEFRVAAASGIPTPATTELARDDQRCNNVLLGSVLASELDFDFGSDGDLIDLVCTPHPLHPKQTLVAMFHHLEESKDDKGLVFASVDVTQKLVHRLYRDTIQQDASIRIDSHSLKIDTTPYNLAPGVRTLGVSMNIGHSPRCAEGGESNYLRLFVEHGEQLELVLKDLPMNQWRITDGISSCGSANPEFTMDDVTLTISVLPTATEGWHDLEVTAHHQIEKTSPTAGRPATMAERTQVLGTLRASGKFYQTGSIRYQIWP